MPNIDPSQIRVAATGAFWKAPYGTAAPTDSTAAYSAAWTHLGYTSDAGFQIAQNYHTKQLLAWQTTEPVRLVITSLDRKISVESLEADKQNLQLAFGSGTVTQNAVSVSGAVTFTAGTITSTTPHGLVAGQWCFFGTVTGTPGVVSGVNYYILAAPTTTTLTVAATLAGTPITITTGSALAVTNSGPVTISIPDSAVAVEFALGIDWSDGGYTNRFIFTRATLLTLPTIKYTRQDQVRFPIEFQILKPLDGSQSMLAYSNDWAASS